MSAGGRGSPGDGPNDRLPARLPVIDVTDLYHPYQDPGDNFDLVAAFGLPEIDLRGVILDITEGFRSPSTPPAENLGEGTPVARDPGFIPVAQLNYIFNRNVPCAAAPFRPMTSPEDPLRDAPGFQQAGIELLLELLRKSAEPVDILVFCSCRAVAAAFNREPALLREKIKCLHLCAGTTSGEIFDVDWGARRRLPVREGSSGYLEWNVQLDPHAFVRLLTSGLPLALYPCATERGPFSMDAHNTYYALSDLSFIAKLHPRLQSYLAYAFHRTSRSDFLRAMDEPPQDLAPVLKLSHHIWETAVWLMVSGRKLVRREGRFRMLPSGEVRPSDEVIPNELRPCTLTVEASGRFHFTCTGGPSLTRIYQRGNPEENQRAYREALADLYQSFQPG